MATEKERRDKHRQKLIAAGLCVNCGKQPVAENSGKRCLDCYKTGRKGTNASRKKQKSLVYDNYGRTCKCCGLTAHEDFLHLDHVNNDGGEHRKLIGPAGIYLWSVRNRFPNTIQPLCANCDSGKRINGGICPHKDPNHPAFQGSVIEPA